MVFLLDHGATPNAADEGGRTPLFGVEDCRKDLIELLESRGGDVRAKSKDGWTRSTGRRRAMMRGSMPESEVRIPGDRRLRGFRLSESSLRNLPSDPHGIQAGDQPGEPPNRRAGRSIVAAARAGRRRTCCGAGRAGSRPRGRRPAARRRRAARPRPATPTARPAAGIRPGPRARPGRRPSGRRGSAAAGNSSISLRTVPGSPAGPHRVAQVADAVPVTLAVNTGRGPRRARRCGTAGRCWKIP